MAEIFSVLDQRFAEAAHGVRWALSQIVGGRETGEGLFVGERSLVLEDLDEDAGDSYEIAWTSKVITLAAGTAVGAIGGLLEIARQVKGGKTRDIVQPIRFKTRVYKHEVQFEAPPTDTRGAHVGTDRPITRYSDAFLEAFFQQIVSRHFNATVVYGGYHPFEWFLDYQGFEHATDKPAELRRRNHEALSRYYQAAKRYGLRTFLHHYVSHFTQALADHLQLGLSEKGTRLAAFDHPAIDEYNRYVYRRTFETIPALDGLYMNFESSGDAIPFMRRTLLQVAKSLPKKPVLFFRLWCVTDVEGMKQLLGEYDGPKGLIHKSHETNDVYYYPVADDRVKVWKKAIPGIEFTFSVGPCHNCGTNISQKLWTDPDYVHALLASIQDKGADSISCQSTRELLLPFLPITARTEDWGLRTEQPQEAGNSNDRGQGSGFSNNGSGQEAGQGQQAVSPCHSVPSSSRSPSSLCHVVTLSLCHPLFPQADHDHARMNLGHHQAIVDYVRSEKPSKKDWAGRYAGWYGVDEKAGEAIRQAIVESSQIILKQYRQFCYGSPQEGYLYPARFSHYQEPFFYYPMSFLNRIGEIPHNVGWRSWAIRNKPIKVVPEDTQAIIDYVNPAVKRKAANHPLAMAGQIRRHMAAARKAIGQYTRLVGLEHGPAARAGLSATGSSVAGRQDRGTRKGEVDDALIAAVERNCRNGERAWREILIGVALYSCYFARSRGEFFRHLRKARDLMRQTAEVLGDNIKDTERYCPTTANGPFIPQQDAAQIDAILAHEKDDFPFPALQAYLKSHERYNEIRRLCRPYVSIREEMTKRNLKLLRESLKAAEQAASLLSATGSLPASASPTSARYALLRDNVMSWVEYVRAEIDWLRPPAMACRSDEAVGSDEGFRRMVHDQCYRWGERCWEDFGSFFVRQDFFREDVCDCRATHTEQGLKLSLREHGIDWAECKATWDKNRGTVNQTGFMRVLLDPGNTGNHILSYVVWFEGCGGTVSEFVEYPNGHIHSGKPSRLTGCQMRFVHTDSSWRFDIVIPWEQLGGKAKRGDVWRLNILSNPAVKRNRRVVWCQGYEYHLDVARLGSIVFQ